MSSLDLLQSYIAVSCILIKPINIYIPVVLNILGYDQTRPTSVEIIPEPYEYLTLQHTTQCGLWINLFYKRQSKRKNVWDKIEAKHKTREITDIMGVKSWMWRWWHYQRENQFQVSALTGSWHEVQSVSGHGSTVGYPRLLWDVSVCDKALWKLKPTLLRRYR